MLLQVPADHYQVTCFDLVRSKHTLEVFEGEQAILYQDVNKLHVVACSESSQVLACNNRRLAQFWNVLESVKIFYHIWPVVELLRKAYDLCHHASHHSPLCDSHPLRNNEKCTKHAPPAKHYGLRFLKFAFKFASLPPTGSGSNWRTVLRLQG